MKTSRIHSFCTFFVVCFLSFAMIATTSPVSAVAQGAQTIPLKTDDGRSYVGLKVDGSSFKTNMAAYEQQALTTKFSAENGVLTDLASAWRTIGMGVALNGGSSSATYHWADFSSKDKDIQNIMMSVGASAGLSRNSYYDFSQNTGYYGFKEFNKNHFAGTDVKFYNSGLQYASSLSAASQNIEKTIQVGYTGDHDFKGGNPQTFNWGEEGATTQDVYYIDNGYAATSWNFLGKKRQNRFAHTGIFFYNFKVTPYIQEGYNPQIIGQDDPEYVEGKGVFQPEFALTDNTIYNESPTATMTAKKVFEQNGEETTTATVTHSATQTKVNGYNYSFGLDGESSWDKLARLNFRSSYSYNMSVSEAISSGWTNSKAKKAGFKESSEVQVNVPPLNRAILTADYGHYNQSVAFDCPFCLSFDVAVINWVHDASDDSATSKVGLVEKFTSTGGAIENAHENLDQKMGLVWWSNLLGAHAQLSSFQDGLTVLGNAARSYIPVSDQHITLTYSRPALLYRSTTYEYEPKA